MRGKILLSLLIVVVVSIFAAASYSASPGSNGKVLSQSTNKTATTKKKSTQISLSFTLFQKLMNMKPTAVTQYLKQQGCKVDQSG